jgi:ubiquitin C-terminal hydrolase
MVEHPIYSKKSFEISMSYLYITDIFFKLEMNSILQCIVSFQRIKIMIIIVLLYVKILLNKNIKLFRPMPWKRIQRKHYESYSFIYSLGNVYNSVYSFSAFKCIIILRIEQTFLSNMWWYLY